MRITDSKVAKAAAIALETIAFAFDDVGSALADALRGAFKPGYAFEIVSVQHFVRDVTAVFSYDVKIGATSALDAAAVPADAARDDAVLGALADRQGGADDEINLHLTTDGAGLAEEGVVYVTIRPRHMHGDPDPVL